MEYGNRLQLQIRNLIAAILVIAICAVFKATRSFSVNFILSLFVCMLFLPVCFGLEKAKVPPFVATIISILLMIIVVILTFFFIVYSIDVLISKLPAYTSRIEYVDTLVVNLVRRWVSLPEDFSLFSFLDVDWIGSVVLPALKTISGSAIAITKNLFMTILMSVFLLVERHTFVPKIIEISKTDNKERVKTVFDRTYKQVSKYLSLKVIISLITGLCFFGICKFVHMDFAIILGALTFVLNFIPTFGSIVVTLLTISVAIFQFLPDWTPVIIVSIGTIVTQNLLGNIIEPKLQGSQLNLSPFVILISISLFAFIWGIVGTFLAVPILSVFVIVFANMEGTKGVAVLLSSGSSLTRKEKKKQSEDTKSSKFGDVLFD